MKKLSRGLDVFFQILQVLFVVTAIIAGVFLLLTGACFLFNLDPELIGTNYHVLDLEFIELELAQAYAPSKHTVLLISAAELAFAIPCALLGRSCVSCVCSLLSSAKEGLPFHENAGSALKKLALLVLILGVLLNISDLLNYLLVKHYYGLSEVFLSEKILSATPKHEFDFSFLLISGVILLLSYIFRHGQELQQLSDETV